MVAVAPVASAGADPIQAPVSVTTVGTFGCLQYHPCPEGSYGNSLTLSNGSGAAVIAFTGVTSTFTLTNALSPVTLGRFDVTSTDGFTFPTNLANPELPILLFRFLLTFDSGQQAGLFWQFGPGGGTRLPLQMGQFSIGGVPATDISPWDGVVFEMNPPVLFADGSTLLIADAGLVPEPGTLLLLASGLVGGVAARRSQRKTPV
jgi:hypothetical protein